MIYCEPQGSLCSGALSSANILDDTATALPPAIPNSFLVRRKLGEPQHRLGAKGFSLIEMLVALVVLSLSLGVLYQAAMGATRNVRVASEYTDAVMLAESMLAEYSYITDENFSLSGRFGQYDWQISSWPVIQDDGLAPEHRAVTPQALQYLEVVVSWPGRQTSRIVDLLTVVPLSEATE